MQKDGDYILGVDRAELERLRFQHQVWLRQALALWARAGLRRGDRVLDLGCGPGFTTFELALQVGSEGHVLARDQSSSFLEWLGAERDRRGLAQVEPSLGPVETLDLPAGSLDAVYARWLLCWLPDPRVALERAARALRSGGVLVFQEYFDWAAMRLIPESPAFRAGVDACMQSWRAGGGEIDIARQLPLLAEELGLELVVFEPLARSGRVGSLEWRWIGSFFAGYLPRLVERGSLDPAALEAFRAEWARREAADEGLCFAPLMADVILRKP